MVTRIGSLESRLDEAELRSQFGSMWMPDEMREGIGRASCSLIQTTNSSYLFLMTGPSEQRGLLVGGVVGESPARAVLVGATPCARDAAEYPACLKRGSRVVFVIESGGAWKRMITSEIVQVVHTHVASQPDPASCH